LWKQEEIEQAKAAGDRVEIGRTKIAKLGLAIKGYYDTTDPREVVTLMRVPTLRFYPQDAIDEGILTPGQVQALGFDVGATPEPLPEQALPVLLPDFDTWNLPRIIQWATDSSPAGQATRGTEPVALDIAEINRLPGPNAKRFALESIACALQERGDPRAEGLAAFFRP